MTCARVSPTIRRHGPGAVLSRLRLRGGRFEQYRRVRGLAGDGTPGNVASLRRRAVSGGPAAPRFSAPYAAMRARGELRTYPGRVVRPEAFLADLQTDLAGCRVERAAADSYKDNGGPRLSRPGGRALAYRLSPRWRREGWRRRTCGRSSASCFNASSPWERICRSLRRSPRARCAGTANGNPGLDKANGARAALTC